MKSRPAMGLAAALVLALTWAPTPRAAGPTPARSINISYEVDDRVELLSAVVMLAAPQLFAEQFHGRTPAYALDAARHFSPMSRHPAVSRMSRWVLAGKAGITPAQILLQVSAVPALEEGLAMRHFGQPEATAFLEELRDFAVRSEFRRFFDSHRATYAGYVAQARGESRDALTPEGLSAYLKLPFSSRYRFILAPLLPSVFASNLSDKEQELRIRPAIYSKENMHFGFEEFESSVVHDLMHTITVPLNAALGKDLPRYDALWVSCSNPSNCLDEQVVLAVTRRRFEQESGEDSAEAFARYKENGFSHVQALCERLKEYERPGSPYSNFSDFYPRLISVFREAFERRPRKTTRRESK